jgi:two-component system sensor histidine kinase HydH
MRRKLSQGERDTVSQIKWVILSRAVFAVFLILACIIFSSGEDLSFFSQPFIYLYNISAAILILSIIYLLLINKVNNLTGSLYLQTIVDSLIVTSIVFVTGSYNSIFTFLYLVVIIYTSILLSQKGSVIIAVACSIQYSALIQLEFYSVITPPVGLFYLSTPADVTHIIYRIIIVTSACFAVAVLSGRLALQLRGAKRDLKIAQEHLKRVEKMTAVDELIGGIAHEIKNPLASLSGSIQLLHEDTEPGSYEDKLMQIILRETGRLENIVNDIRLFSKPQTTNATFVNLADKIKDVIELFLKDPEIRKKIIIKTRLDETISVEIDPEHLNQILWNLLTNAAQSIHESGTITISLASPRNQRIYLTIKDTGCGIDSKDYSHIFDPFFTTKPEGTGLGLSIIHRLIDSYGGMIDFESNPEKGTIFTIIFKNQTK